MSQQVINIGGTANDGTGDPLRTAFTKINTNFSELYAKGAAGSNLDMSNNEIAATNSNGNVELVPNGAGKVVVVDDMIVINSSRTPVSTGSPGDKMGSICWDSSHLYVCIANYDGSTVIWKTLSTGVAPVYDFTISNNGTSTISTPNATPLKLVPGTTGDVYLTSDNVVVGDLNTSTTITTNGTGNLIFNTNAGVNSSDITIEEGSAGNIIIAGKTNGNIRLVHYGTGTTNVDKLVLTDGNITPLSDNIQIVSNLTVLGTANTNATLTTNGTGNLTLSTNGGTNSGNIVLGQGANANITITPNGTGSIVLSNLYVSNNQIISTATNANVVLAPNGTGAVRANANVTYLGVANTATTLTSNGTANLTINTNNGTNAGSIVLANGANGNISITPNGTGLTSIARLSLAAGTSTANTAPLKFTSGTNLSTVEAGTIEYDGNLFYATRTTTAGRGLIDTYNRFRLSADLSAIGSATATFFGSSSSPTLLSNAAYEFEWHCYFSKATAGTLTWSLLFNQTPVNVSANYIGSAAAGLGTAGNAQIAGNVAVSNVNVTLPVTASLTNGANHYYIIRATIESHASLNSNINLQATQSAGTLTPLKGSYYLYKRVPTTFIGNFT